METVIAASLKLDSADANKSVKSFKQELKEANANLLEVQRNFGPTSDQALAAARNVAELRDRMQEAREVANLFDPGAKFQVFGNVLRTVAGGMTALTGTLALFGEESKDVEKAILKVQAALAVTEGVNTIVDAAKDFDRLKAVAVDAFKSIKAAIGSTGIGAIVIAVGLLVTYWDDIKEAVFGVSTEQTKSLELAKKAADKEKEKLDHVDDQDEILKSQGKTEKQILELKQAQIKKTIEASEAQLAAQKEIDKAQIATAERNHAILKGILDFLTLPLRAVTETIDSALNAVGINSKLSKGLDSVLNSAANLLFDPADMKKKADAANKEAEYGITKLKNQQAGYHNQIVALNKEALQKERDFQKQLRDIRTQADNVFIKDANLIAKEKLDADNKNAIEAINAQQISQKKKNQLLLEQERLYNNQLVDLTNESEKTRFLAEIEAAQKKVDAKKKINGEGLLNFQSNALVQLDAQRSLNDELALLNQDDAAKQSAKQLEDLNTFVNEKLRLVKRGSEQETEILKYYEAAKTEITRLEHDNRLMIVSNLLGKAADLFAQNTAAYKILAIAQATINTYLGVSDALAAKTFTIFDTVIKFVNAGVILAAGLANVKRIVSVQVPGGGGGSAPGIPSLGSGAQAPLTPRPEVGNTQLPQDQLNQIGNATVRAFVVESDVTNNQERVSRLNRAARLGG